MIIKVLPVMYLLAQTCARDTEEHPYQVSWRPIWLSKQSSRLEAHSVIEFETSHVGPGRGVSWTRHESGTRG